MKIRDTLYLILVATFLLAFFFVVCSDKSQKVQALEVIIEEAEQTEIMSVEIQNLRKSTDEVMYQTYEILHLVDEVPSIGSDKKTCNKKSNPQ